MSKKYAVSINQASQFFDKKPVLLKILFIYSLKAYFTVLSESWKKEVCKGFDPLQMARILRDHHFLDVPQPDRMKQKVAIPSIGDIRCYIVKGEILNYE